MQHTFRTILTCIVLTMLSNCSPQERTTVTAEEISSALPQTHISMEHLYANQEEQAEFIIKKIREYFPNPREARIMLTIAKCESTGLIHWLPDGSLRPNSAGESSAAGVFQVLLKKHREMYEKIGLDMHDIDDYMKFVVYLKKTQGFSAWQCYLNQ